MAQPKRRWSKARTGLKRSTWKIEEKNLATCPHCHEPVMQHRVCSNCGYYNGKEVVAVKEDNKKEETHFYNVFFFMPFLLKF